MGIIKVDLPEPKEPQRNVRWEGHELCWSEGQFHYRLSFRNPSDELKEQLRKVVIKLGQHVILEITK